MNSEHANSIPLSEILKKIDCLPIADNGYDVWYRSPFCPEQTAILYVNSVKNTWHDFGDDKGGNVIDFVCTYLKSHGEDNTVVDAKRWLRNMLPTYSFSPLLFPKENSDNESTGFVLQELSALQHPVLLNYLDARGIPPVHAKKYLKEALVRNTATGKRIYTICLHNEGGGYELRNRFFKGCIAPQSISFIRGTKVPAEEIHIFEEFMDFLSALLYQPDNRFAGDVIILNSVTCLPQVFPYIRNYTYKTLTTWLDNDTAGARAIQVLREFAANEGTLVFKTMNRNYAPHKDVNAWHMHKLELHFD